MMRIGLVTTWGTRCGIAQYSMYLARSLSDLGIEVIIFAEKSDLSEEHNNDRIKVIRCWSRSQYDLHQVIEEAQSISVDIIHIQHEYSLFEEHTLMRFLTELKSIGAKNVVTMHSIVRSKATEAKIASLVDKIIVHSEHCRNYMLNINEYCDKVVIIPHGSPNIVTMNTAELREKFNIKSNHVIASFGFMQPYKGFDIVLEALIQLKQKYHDILYLIASSIRPKEKNSLEYYWKLRRIISKNGLSGNVRLYHDFLPESIIQEILQLSDIIVLYYGFNLTNATSAAVRFSLASLRPVIVSKINFFADLNDEVIKVEPNSPTKLVQSITNLFEDDNLRDQLIKNAHRLLINTSWHKIAEKHLQMYINLKKSASITPSYRKIGASTLKHKNMHKTKSISVCYIVYNEELFLKYSIKSIYNFADQIIIVDGSPQGASTDNTKTIVDSFGTEKIIYVQGTFMDKKEQRNEYLKYITGDWILVVDGDEVYKYSHLQRLRKIIETRHDIVAIHFDFIHFWKDLKHYRVGNIFSDIPFRCYMYQKGMHYREHYLIANSDGQFIDYLPNVYYDSIIKAYHYGYVKPLQDIRAKMIYYAKRGDAGSMHQKDPEAFADYFIKNEWKLDRPDVYKYSGRHPFVIQQYIKAVKNKNEQEIT